MKDFLGFAKGLHESDVKHEHARILREGIARLHKYLPVEHKPQAVDILKRFAKAVRPYCKCGERSKIRLKTRFVERCLNCGQDHQLMKALDKNG